MAKEPKKGIVYIVQNSAFPHLCKIGRTGEDTIEARGLNASNVPEDFEVLFGYECNNPEEVEKHLHERFENFRHYSKTGRKTEFFYVGCLLKAQKTLTLLSQSTKEISGEDILLGESDKAEYVGEIPKRKSPFTFDMVNIEPGETLVFMEDENEKCTVENNKTVLYKNKEYSLSKLAKELMEKLGPPNEAYQGPKFFKVKGETETLNEKRERMEREDNKAVAKQAKENPPIESLYNKVINYIKSLGGSGKECEVYWSFRKNENYFIGLHKNHKYRILMRLKLNPKNIELDDGFTKNVSKIPGYASGDLEIRIKNEADFKKAKPLIERAYKEN
jgi:predicted transport protein